MKILFVSVIDLFGVHEKPERTPGYTMQSYVEQGDRLLLITNHERNLKYRAYGVSVWRLPKLFPKRFGPAANIFNNAILFPILAFPVILFALLKESFDLLYLYEVHGVLAGFWPSIIFRKPRIHRFQGTYFVTPYLKRSRLSAWLRHPDYVTALALPAPLTLMTDDGTRGDEVLKRVRLTKRGKILFWKNGIEIKKITKNKIQDLSHFFMMTLCRLVPFKGVDRAIDILSCLQSMHPNYFKLIIVGSGPEKEKLRSLVCEKKLNSSVQFIGNIRHEQISEYLSKADLFLSLYQTSNLGNPLLEAMWMKVPILTLDEGTTSELVRDRKDGILLRSYSPEAAAQRILEISKNPESLSQLGLAGQKRVKEFYSEWNDRLANEREEILKLI